MKQENKHNVQINEVFKFKNQKTGYEWTEKVTRMNDKSVFSTWKNGHEFRESWNTFNKKIENSLLKREMDIVTPADTKFMRTILK